MEFPGTTAEEKLEHLTTRHLGEAAAAGDVYCQRLFEGAAGWVTAGLAQLLGQGWGEDRIVVGGSVAEKVPGFLDRVRAVLGWHQQESSAPPGLSRFRVEDGLVAAGLGSERGVLGAVFLAAEASRAPRRSVRWITAEQARPIRQSIWRAHQEPEACVYEGDESEGSAHFGAVRSGHLVGVASIYRQNLRGEEDPFSWRLRGMATLENVRGHGYGLALLEACIHHARRQGGMRLWCNARTSVSEFYGKGGFKVRGEEFDLPGLGPHFVMELEL